MTIPSKNAHTLLDLFESNVHATTLSWFSDDLLPRPGWSASSTDPSGWCSLSGSNVRDHVRTLAAALVEAGVSRGDRVALMMPNRPEHWLSDLAVLHAGAVPTTFYPTLSRAQVRSQAGHVGVSAVVLEGSAQVEQWSHALEHPDLRRVIVLNENVTPTSATVEWQTYAEALERGKARLSREPSVIEERVQGIRPEELATIIFTSGTTADPKAVPLTHRNVLAAASGLQAAGNPPVPYRSVSYLPTAHILDRLCNIYVVLLLGGEIAFSPNADALHRVVARSRPTSFAGVPRIWEKLLTLIESVPEDRSLDALRLAGLGDVALATTAGAPMPAVLAERLRSHGLPLVDMWGLTEASGAITASSAAAARPHTVGRPLPGSEIRLAADGELMLRGPQITPGYLRPDGTTKSITDAEGWLPTGDLGGLDADGYVHITDRKKELIVTSGGKNVSPVAVESLLVRSPLVAQAATFGNDHPYIVALLTIDPEGAKAWMEREHGIATDELSADSLVEDPTVQAEVARAVDEANEELARSEQVKRWQLLPRPWSPEDGTLTPTHKMRRAVIEDRHRAALTELYRSASSRVRTQ